MPEFGPMGDALAAHYLPLARSSYWEAHWSAQRLLRRSVPWCGVVEKASSSFGDPSVSLANRCVEKVSGSPMIWPCNWFDVAPYTVLKCRQANTAMSTNVSANALGFSAGRSHEPQASWLSEPSVWGQAQARDGIVLGGACAHAQRDSWAPYTIFRMPLSSPDSFPHVWAATSKHLVTGRGDAVDMP